MSDITHFNKVSGIQGVYVGANDNEILVADKDGNLYQTGVNVDILALLENVNEINEVIVDMFQEQADVPVEVNAVTGGVDILHFNEVDTRYILRELTIKAVDPGADTITIALLGLVNDVLTTIDTFDITTTNFGTYFNLIDMFGLVDFPGDEIKITATTDAGTYAITGQYSHALTGGG